MKKRIVAFVLLVITVVTLFPLQVFAEEPTPLQITEQPKNAKVELGKEVCLTVAAEGDGLTYQWYIQLPGADDFIADDCQEATCSFPMTAERNGCKLYCVITDVYGAQIQSDTVTLSVPVKAKITKQPVGGLFPFDKKSTVKVEAIGDALTYQWYVQKPGQTTFVKTSATTNVYSFTMTKAASGSRVYCEVTDYSGKSIKSSTVTLKGYTALEITKQPTHAGVAKGKRVSTTVSVKGEGLKYQWYLYEPKATKARKSTITKATYSYKMTKAKSGRRVYCVITDAYGKKVTTNTVTLKIPTALKITKQPTDAYADIGSKASTTVKVTGDGVKYQWYVQNPGGSGFAKSSITGATYSYQMTKEKVGRRAYCVITDMYGKKVTTSTVTFAVAKGEFDRSLYKVKPGKTRVVDLIVTEKGKKDEIIWTSSNPAVAKVNAKGVVTGVKYGTATITALGKNTGFAATCKVKVCNVKQVAITFDDGPAKRTGELLDFLKKNDIRVTFFLVGNRISSYKNTVKRQVAEGHEIGYHSWDHTNQKKLTDAKIISDFNKAAKTLKNVAGGEFTVWRTPGGNRDSRVLNCIDLPHIMWSVDTLDWKYRNSTRTCNQIKNRAVDGSIVLLHDLHSTTVTGAMKALKQMQDGDYEFLTVTELLSRNGRAPKPNCSYSKG